MIDRVGKKYVGSILPVTKGEKNHRVGDNREDITVLKQKGPSTLIRKMFQWCVVLRSPVSVGLAYHSNHLSHIFLRMILSDGIWCHNPFR